MQIELFGCTSAGKSSLLDQILQTHAEQHTSVVSSNEFILGRMRLTWVTGTPRLIALNLLCILMCVLAWRKHRVFLHHVINCIRHLRPSVPLLQRMRILRISLRNVGAYEFVERYAPADQAVLSDEGTLQIAHYLFVHISVEPHPGRLETFAALMPLPAAVVYLSQPVALLVQRTSQRGHKRIPLNCDTLVERFVARAAITFDILLRQPAVRDKLLVVDARQNVLTTTAATMEQQLQRAYDIIRPVLPPAAIAESNQ